MVVCIIAWGKFWEYKELLFTNQQECTEQEDIEDLSGLYSKFALEAGLDEKQFRECFESGKYREKVEAQKQESILAKVYGTPTFLVNGKVLVASKSIEEFSSIIDTELEG